MQRNIQFETDRLIISEFLLSDVEPFYEMQRNPNVMQYIKPALSYAQAKSELDLFIKYYSDSNKFYNLWAVHTKNKDFVGLCGVYLDQQDEYQIAYRLTESSWGVGYGSEMARGLIAHCIDTLRLPYIVAYALVANIGSTKILTREMNLIDESINQETGTLGRKYSLKKK